MGSVVILIHVIQMIVVRWLTVAGESVCHAGTCSCAPFGKTRIKVECNFTRHVPSGIPSNTALLNLPGCSLNSISEDSFRNLKLLKKLDLSSNLIEFIPQNTFRNLTSLKIINLKDNRITGGFYLPQNVENILLANNLLFSADLKLILEGLKQLRVMNIDGNKRIGPTLPSDVFAGLVKMKQLSISHCSLEHIDNGTFRAMFDLTHLKRKITKEVEKRWPPGSALPVYRNKADALQVDKFVAKLVEDDTHLFAECGFGKEAVLETVLKKIREQRRQQKERPLTKEEVLSTDSASESTESAESSSGSPSPPTYTSQLQRVKAYNLYFDEDMPQTTADLIVMVALGKPSIKEVKMDQLQKMKKIFNLGILRGKDKMTYIRAIANSLRNEGYITIPESKEEDQGSVTRGDVKVVKEIILGESTAKDS